MRVTPPVPITPAKLVSSTAADVHAPASYAGGTTYALGAIVSVVADYKIYESLQAGNIGKTPSSEPLWWRAIGATETAYNAGTTYALGATVSSAQRVYESLQASNTGHALPVLPETQTEWWIDVGPTNKWAMFDADSNTQTVQASPLTVVFAPGERINTIGVTGLEAQSITITATSVFGGGVVWGPETTDLIIRGVTDGYTYAFEPFGTRPSLVNFDFPPYSDIVVTIIISSASGNVKCGSIVAGTYVYIGDVQYGAKGDALNFSTIDRDLYGTATLVKRRSVPKTNQSLIADAIYVNKIRAARTALNAVPALWTGLDDGSSNYFDMLAMMGVYKQFEIDASNYTHATINLEIEEI